MASNLVKKISISTKKLYFCENNIGTWGHRDMGT